MKTTLHDKPSKKVTRFLRFYRTECESPLKVSRHQTWFTGDPNEAAEKISIQYENDKFFRWYEPLEQQVAGRHW